MIHKVSGVPSVCVCVDFCEKLDIFYLNVIQPAGMPRYNF
jgi:hypothetical protein